MLYRIGIGYDIHRLVEGRKLFIGGIELPYFKGLQGHSDADVLLHALCDALLGAAAEPDIGELFPDTSAEYQGVSSVKLLSRAATIIKKKGYAIGNVDLVIIAEEPKLTPFKQQIKARIAGILDIKEDCVGVKAKSNEGLGEIGRKEAISCYAVAVIGRRR